MPTRENKSQIGQFPTDRYQEGRSVNLDGLPKQWVTIPILNFQFFGSNAMISPVGQKPIIEFAMGATTSSPRGSASPGFRIKKQESTDAVEYRPEYKVANIHPPAFY